MKKIDLVPKSSALLKKLNYFGPVLLAFTLILLVSASLMQWRLSRLAYQPKSIAQVGGEKHLVQSMQEATVSLLNTEDGVSFGSRLKDLHNSRQEWMGVHAKLVEASNNQQLHEKVREELEERVFPLYEDILTTTDKLFSALEAAEGEISISDLQPYVKDVHAQTGLYLFFLNHLDLHLADEVSGDIISAQYTEGLFLLITSFLLFLATLFVVFPARRMISTLLRQLTMTLQDIRDKNDLLTELFLKVENRSVDTTGQLNQLAHDVRNPIATMLGYAELLNQVDAETQKSEESTKYTAGIKRNGELALRTLEDFLEMAQIEGGKDLTNVSKFSLEELIQTFKTDFSDLARRQGLKFRISVSKDAPANLETDQVKLERVIQNLLSNAFKFTEKGFIKLSFSSSPNDNDGEPYLKIEVTDSGEGISEYNLEKVFEPFSKFSHRTDSIGLGLPITKQLVTVLKGRIEVESEVKKGSTFRVVIPQTLPSEKKDRATRQLNDPDRESDLVKMLKSSHKLLGKKIVFIEDDPELRTLGTSFLTSIGTEVIGVESAEAAFEQISKIQKGDSKTDMIFIDIGLPGLSGLEATKKLRKDYHIECPIIAVSSYDRSLWNQCLQAGCTDIIEKPLTSLKIAESLVHSL